MPGWSRPRGLVFEEFKQAREEGKDPAALEALRVEADDCGEDFLRNDALHARMLALPVQAGFPYEEPDGLEGIRAALSGERFGVQPVAGDLADRMQGAWLGRCIGCALGKPVESMGMRGIDVDGLRPWRRLKAYLTAIDPAEWPIRGYIPAHSPAESDPRIGPVSCPDSTRERIAFAETDDDLRYTVLGLILLQEKGLGFTTRDVADNWIGRLPYRLVCTAETQAYHNLVARYEFHADAGFWGAEDPIDWAWVATHRNPYREWIGAQIRVDPYGYAAPGDPGRAAEMAWRDARLSHTKNGVYGAMFCAAMIAASFATSDPVEVVRAGLGEIPASSRLAEAIRRTMALVPAHGPEEFEALLDAVHGSFEGYSTVHTIPNAALCAAAVLAGGGDFHRSVTLAVMGAWDTDCNGATVGSIAGAMAGARSIPPLWSAPLHDTLRSGIPDYHPVAISECARRMLAVIEADDARV